MSHLKAVEREEADHVRLPRSVLELFRFASTDEKRPNLNIIDISHIKYQRGPQSKSLSMACATNGHHMARLVFNAGFNFPEFQIKSTQAKEILKGVKKDDCFELSTNVNRIQIDRVPKSKKQKIERYSFFTGEFSFPDSTNIFEDSRSATKEKECIALDLQYIVVLHDFLRKVDQGTGIKLFTNGSIYDPCFLEKDFNECRFSYVIMPVRF